MDGEKDDAPPPRQTYMPKPPSKEEVDQISREQGMIADDWTGEPSAGEAGEVGGTPAKSGGGSPAGEGGGA